MASTQVGFASPHPHPNSYGMWASVRTAKARRKINGNNVTTRLGWLYQFHGVGYGPGAARASALVPSACVCGTRSAHRLGQHTAGTPPAHRQHTAGPPPAHHRHTAGTGSADSPLTPRLCVWQGGAAAPVRRWLGPGRAHAQPKRLQAHPACARTRLRTKPCRFCGFRFSCTGPVREPAAATPSSAP